MTADANRDAQEMLRRMYDETLAGNFRCVETMFHPRYRSLTEAAEDSPAAYVAGTEKLLRELEILQREVLFTLGDAQRVGIVHRVRFRPKGSAQAPVEQLRADIYELEGGRFVRHWGIPPL